LSTAKTLFVVADGFFSAMLTVILACYTEYEDRVGLIGKTGSSSTAYDVVKKFAEDKVGKFTGADVVANCPRIGSKRGGI